MFFLATFPFMENTDKKSFGRRLDAAIRRKGIGQAELSRMLKLKQPVTLWKWINGKAMPRTVESLVALADILEVTTDYLLGRDKYNDPNVHNMLKQILERLPTADGPGVERKKPK